MKWLGWIKKEKKDFMVNVLEKIECGDDVLRKLWVVMIMRV
ncbi:hypothetical protein [Staphylococcus hominis]|nr:hypothetical protein [Staphylococcus hominis]